MTEGIKTIVSFDQGDRVSSISNGDSRTAEAVSYDDVTGCVASVGASRRYWHNSAGQLVQMVTLVPASRRVSLHYDHLGRLSAWTGHGTSDKAFAEKFVSQLFYTDVRHPTRLTAVHNPRLETMIGNI